MVARRVAGKDRGKEDTGPKGEVADGGEGRLGGRDKEEERRDRSRPERDGRECRGEEMR